MSYRALLLYAVTFILAIFLLACVGGFITSVLSLLFIKSTKEEIISAFLYLFFAFFSLALLLIFVYLVADRLKEMRGFIRRLARVGSIGLLVYLVAWVVMRWWTS